MFICTAAVVLTPGASLGGWVKTDGFEVVRVLPSKQASLTFQLPPALLVAFLLRPEPGSG